MNIPVVLFIKLTRWLDGLRHLLIENKFSSSPHKWRIQKIIELESISRCQLIYPLPTAGPALPQAVLTALAVLSWRTTGSSDGDKAAQRSLNRQFSACAQWELRNLHSFHSFWSIMVFQLFWLVCWFFLAFLCSPWGRYGLFEAWFLEETGWMTVHYGHS